MSTDGNVYEAERILHVRGIPSRLDDPQAYYDYMSHTKWFMDRWGWLTEKDVQVKKSTHAAAWSYFETCKIYLPPWAQTDLVLIHEAAHFATDAVDHETGFRRNYLLMVRHFMGTEAHQALKHGFLAFGLDV